MNFSLQPTILYLFLTMLITAGSCKEESVDTASLNLSADQTEISEGEAITFSDGSIGQVSEHLWTFEGGDPSTSSDVSPTVTYAKAGFYDVELSASGPGGTLSDLKESYIKVGCKGLYCEDSFAVQLTKNIIYGKDSAQHLMHIYQPQMDPRPERPAVILLGGGAFKGSNLDYLDELARKLCSRGVVVAAARYRNGSEPQSNMIRGQQDARAAVRYLKAYSQIWRVDTNAVFCGGNGTGAFLSYFMAYVSYDELDANGQQTVDGLGGLEGDQGHSGYSSAIAGVIALAGGMYGDISFISAGDPPLFAIHGTLDPEVPYTSKDLGGLILYGAQPIVDRALQVGITAELFTIEGGDHSAPRRLSELYIDSLMWFIRELID